jgi:CRISPR-associated protein Cmr2
MTYMALFSITPVQAYISKARKLRDLYAGSKILSFLAAAGLKTSGKAVYPSPGSPSAPNKFVFEVEAENATAVKARMKQIEDTVQAEWLNLADIAGVPFDLVDDYWQYAWAALPWDGQNYADAHSKLQGLLVAAKLKPNRIRKPQEGKKCPLCGENQVWKKLKDDFGREEELCGVCAIKRRMPECPIPREHPLYDLSNQLNFPMTTQLAAHRYIQEHNLSLKDIDAIHHENDGRLPDIQKYYAILLMDGDKMGDLVNTKKDTEEHQELSRTLDAFTGSIAVAEPGRLIYAGGDDVCAVLPLETALETAKTIRELYTQKVTSKYANGKNATISAALVMVHHKEPLREAIGDSHTFLDTLAKDRAGRDALAIVLRKRSGGDRSVFFKWDGDKNPFYARESLLQSFEAVTAGLSDNALTTGLVYRLGQLRDAVFGIIQDKNSDSETKKERIVKMFAYEVEHSCSRGADTELTARRLAGLCLPKADTSDPARPDDFNPEAPLIAHFLSKAAK